LDDQNYCSISSQQRLLHQYLQKLDEPEPGFNQEDRMVDVKNLSEKEDCIFFVIQF